MELLRLSLIAAAIAGMLLTKEPGFAQTPDSNSADWGTEKSELTSTPQYAKSKAICRHVADLEAPERDQPTPAQAKALKGCSSEKLYFVASQPISPCAFSDAMSVLNSMSGVPATGVCAGPIRLMKTPRKRRKTLSDSASAARKGNV